MNWDLQIRSLWRELLALKRRVAGLATTGGGSGITTLTGDVTAGPGSGSQAATIANDAVTNAKLDNMAQSTIKGRAAAAGTGDPQDLTANQVSTILDSATDPFVRTSAAAAGYTDEQAQDAVGAMLDTTLEYVDATPLLKRAALTGDVTASSGSNATTIANDAVTDAKLRNSGACSVIGRSANSSGDPADISSSADGQVLRRASGSVGFGAVDLADSDAVTGQLPLANLAALTTSLEFVFGDSVNAIGTTDTIRFDIPVNATLTKWRIVADASGSIQFDVKTCTYAGFPGSLASIIDTGSGGTKPALSSVQKNEDSTLAHYTTSFTAGDVGLVIIDSAATVKQATLILTFTY